jgi:hypothetical protein
LTNYFVSYDLTTTNPAPHSEFLDQAEIQGWSRWVWAPAKGKWYRLPNTFLVGDFPNRDAAKKAFDDAKTATATEIGKAVTVEKFFLATYSSSLFNSDETADPGT